jgi:hypothetical protein
LQSSIKFKIINIAIEALGGLRNLRVGIPFQEAGISCKKMESESQVLVRKPGTHVLS